MSLQRTLSVAATVVAGWAAASVFDRPQQSTTLWVGALAAVALGIWARFAQQTLGIMRTHMSSAVARVSGLWVVTLVAAWLLLPRQWTLLVVVVLPLGVSSATGDYDRERAKTAAAVSMFMAPVATLAVLASRGELGSLVHFDKLWLAAQLLTVAAGSLLAVACLRDTPLGLSATSAIRMQLVSDHVALFVVGVVLHWELDLATTAAYLGLVIALVVLIGGRVLRRPVVQMRVTAASAVVALPLLLITYGAAVAFVVGGLTFNGAMLLAAGLYKLVEKAKRRAAEQEADASSSSDESTTTP